MRDRMRFARSGTRIIEHLRSLLTIVNFMIGVGGILVFFRTTEWAGITLGFVLFSAGFGTFSTMVLSTTIDESRSVLYYISGGPALISNIVLSAFGAYSMPYASESESQFVAFWSMVIGAANCCVLVRVFRSLTQIRRTDRGGGAESVDASGL